jgi:hypothetical protein
MKLHKPLFSTILILIQLLFAVNEHIQHQNWKKENPDIEGIICFYLLYPELFLFVLIIGVFEMLTKPGWFKTMVRILLAGIVVGAELSKLAPINQLYHGFFNTAGVCALIAFVWLLFRFWKFGYRKIMG